MADRRHLGWHPRRGITGDAALASAAAALATGIGATASILVARELSVAGRGEWAVISSLAILVGTACSAGLPAAGAYAAAQVDARARARITSAVFIAALGLASLALVAGAIAAAVTQHGPEREVALFGGSVLAAGYVIHNIVHQLLLTTVPLRRYAAVQLLPNVVMLAGVVAVVLATGLTVAWVAAASIAGSVIATGAAVVILRRAGLVPLSWWGNALPALRPYAGFAIMSFGVVACTQVVQRIDVLIVDGIAGPRSAGLYAVAVQVGELLLIVPAALGAVLFRRAATSAQGHWRDAVRVMSATLALGLAIGALLVAFADPLLNTLFGARYVGAAEALRLLVPGLLFLCLQSIVSSYVAGRGRPRSVFFAWLVAGVGNISLNLVLVPAYGITGAALASTISYAVVLVLHVHPIRIIRAQERDGGSLVAKAQVPT